MSVVAKWYSLVAARFVSAGGEALAEVVATHLRTLDHCSSAWNCAGEGAKEHGFLLLDPVICLGTAYFNAAPLLEEHTAETHSNNIGFRLCSQNIGGLTLAG